MRDPPARRRAAFTLLVALLATEAGADMDNRLLDLVLPTLSGEPASLAQFRGRPIMLVDFASW